VDQHVAEDHLAFVVQDVPDDRIAVGGHVLDDAEDAGLHVGGAELAVDDAEVREIVSDDVLAGDHCGRGLAAGGGIRAAEIRLASLRAVGPHDEHVLGQPAFAVGLANRQTQGELLEAHRVAGVLRVDGVDRVVDVVDVDAVVLVVLAGHALGDLAGAVAELEELEGAAGALAFEFLVAFAVQHVLAVDDVGRVGDLQTRNREDRVDRAQAEEPHEHGPALVGAALELFHLAQALLALELLELGVQRLALGHQVLGDLGVASLVVVAVEVDGVAGGRQGNLLLIVDRQLAAIGGVFVGVGAHPNPVRGAQLDGPGDERVDVLVLQGVELLQAGFVHLAFQD